MSGAIEAAAAQLYAARSGGVVPVLPTLTTAQAYEVQARVAALGEHVVGGWKVAIGPQGVAVAAPLFASTILPSGAELAIGEARGGLKLETEIGFRLGSDLPRRATAYDRTDILTAIESVHAAFEIVGPRAGEPPDGPFPAFLADNLGNAFTILGAAIPFRRPMPATGMLLREGASIAAGSHPLGDPLAPLLHYANNPWDALGGLRRGHLVITGSFTGVIPVEGPSRYEGRFHDWPAVTFFSN